MKVPKVAGAPKGVPDHSPGLRRIGATPGRRILPGSPVRAAQTLGMPGFCATLSWLSPSGGTTRGRRETRQPRAAIRSPFRAFHNGNPKMWDFFAASSRKAPRLKVWNPERGSGSQPGVAPYRRYPGWAVFTRQPFKGCANNWHAWILRNPFRVVACGCPYPG